MYACVVVSADQIAIINMLNAPEQSAVKYTWFQFLAPCCRKLTRFLCNSEVHKSALWKKILTLVVLSKSAEVFVLVARLMKVKVSPKC